MIKMASVLLPSTSTELASKKRCCGMYTGDAVGEVHVVIMGKGFSIRGTHSQSGFHYLDNSLQKPCNTIQYHTITFNTVMYFKFKSGFHYLDNSLQKPPLHDAHNICFFYHLDI